MDSTAPELAEWTEVMRRHRNDAEVADSAPLLAAAGVTPDELAAALTDPQPLLLWCQHRDTEPWSWISDPIARSLVCAEISKRASTEANLFADLRAAAVAEAVNASTVSAVGRRIGVRQQVVSRLHQRGRRDRLEPLLDWFTSTFRQPPVAATSPATDEGAAS